MKPADLPALNLDAATALALPLADVEARAQFRFCFRLPSGDEEWLLARLCVIEPDAGTRHLYYCVVLRPENAQDNRILITYDLEFRSGRRKLDYRMTPAQGEIFKWDLFEQGFNDKEYAIMLARFWTTEENGNTTLLKFWAGDLGVIMGQKHSLVAPSSIEHFRWKRRRMEPEIAKLQILRTTNLNFRRQIRALLNNEESEMRIALRWVNLSEREKDEIAFACESGSWAQLREVAAWVLTVRLAHQKRRCEQTSVWRLAAYESIEVRNNPGLDGDEALAFWHIALAEAFGARGLSISGMKIESMPHGLWGYIDSNQQSKISVAPPTMHEAMEAQLKLRDWADENCAPDEAARLLALLA